jgi:competence protein ComEA
MLEVMMFELTVRQRIAAVVLLIFLASGGLLLFVSANKSLTQEYFDDATINKIYVDVCGAVARPGVKQLKPGARKFEALEQAGGALPEADLNQINLAEFVEDGEQIYLPKKGEISVLPTKKHRKNPTLHNKKTNRVMASNIKSKAGAKKTTPKWPIDLNSADQEMLELVPGIGKMLAARIIEFRNKNGNFINFEELDGVNGIGPNKLEKLRPYLYVK